MVLFIKEIFLKFFLFFGKALSFSKEKVVVRSEGKPAISILTLDLKSSSVQNIISQITTVSESKDDIVSDIIDDGDNQVDNTGPIVIPDIIDEDVTFVRELPLGNDGFGIPLDTKYIRLATGANKGQYYNFAPSSENYNDVGARSLLLFSNIFYKSIEDPEPIPMDELVNYIAIIKNGSGKAFFPQWGFSGIQGAANGEGFLIKTLLPTVLKVTGKPNVVVDSVDDFDLALVFPPSSVVPNSYQWQQITNPFLTPIDIKQYFGTHITYLHYETVTAAGSPQTIADIEIMKNSSAQTIIPRWDFYGFDTMLPGEQYQIRADFSTFGSVGNHVYKSGH